MNSCHRCHSQKVKCSGDKPCQSCSSTGRADECEFPANKERKVPVPERYTIPKLVRKKISLTLVSYLKKLEEDSRKLQAISTHNQTPEPTPFHNVNVQDDSPPSLSKEESNLFNPLFDRQPEKPIQERSSEPGFIGEASCAAFSNRLLSCLDDTYTPSTAGLSNYLKLNTYDRLSVPEFPERMHVKLLLNVARRFIGNYHPLFLEVTFMKEIDAVYRREMVPSSLWLCKFYALMALGEIYTHRRGVGDNNRVPGTNYYVRAVGLLQENHDYYEEPSLMQVEVLTLLVSTRALS